MKTEREYVPTPEELSEIFELLPTTQKLQFESIMKMFTVLLISVHQASQTERKIENE